MPILKLCRSSAPRPPSGFRIERVRAALYAALDVCRLMELAVSEETDAERAALRDMLHRDLAGVSATVEAPGGTDVCDACGIVATVDMLARRADLSGVASFLRETRLPETGNAVRRMGRSLASVFVLPASDAGSYSCGEMARLARAREAMREVERVRGQVLSVHEAAGDPETGKAARLSFAAANERGDMDGDDGFLISEARLDKLMRMVELKRGQHLHIVGPDECDPENG